MVMLRMPTSEDPCNAIYINGRSAQKRPFINYYWQDTKSNQKHIYIAPYVASESEAHRCINAGEGGKSNQI